MINDSLNTVVKASGFFLFGTIISSIFLLSINILIARYWGQTNLGLFTLAFSILQLLSTIGALEIAQGVSRNLAFYNAKKQDKIVTGIISSSVLITIIVSSAIAVALFIFSGYIAENIFHEPLFKMPLMIFAIAIPIKNISRIFLSISKGFKILKPLVYFQQILENTLFFVFVVSLLFLNESFVYVFYFYLLSLTISSIIIVIYIKKRVVDITFVSNKKLNFSQAKFLLLFSLPLLGVALLNTSTNWINNIMIAGLGSISDVGLYKAVGVITGFIGAPSVILLALYNPVMSNLFSRNKVSEINRIYKILTKWLCFFTLPMFLFLFIFSEQVINLFYGSDYLIGTFTFKILAIGAIITNFSGPNGATLVSIGKPKFVLYSLAISSLANIILNIYLIPKYGIEGAAIALAAAIIMFNLSKSLMLYREIGTIPIGYNLLKPSILAIFTGLIFYFFIKKYFFIENGLILLFLFTFYALYFVFFLISRSIDYEDIQIVKLISNKIHINTDFLTNLMSKFKN